VIYKTTVAGEMLNNHNVIDLVSPFGSLLSTYNSAQQVIIGGDMYRSSIVIRGQVNDYSLVISQLSVISDDCS